MHIATSAKSLFRGPSCIALGLVVVLATQAGLTLPLAAAIALIGLGATLVLNEARSHPAVLLLNVAVYLLLVILACSAEWNQSHDALTALDCVLAGGITVATWRTAWYRLIASGNLT